MSYPQISVYGFIVIAHAKFTAVAASVGEINIKIVVYLIYVSILHNDLLFAVFEKQSLSILISQIGYNLCIGLFYLGYFIDDQIDVFRLIGLTSEGYGSHIRAIRFYQKSVIGYGFYDVVLDCHS